MTSGKKGVHFFGKECCEKCAGVKAAEKKKIEKMRQKPGCQLLLSKRDYFGTPLYTMCWINKGDDKGRGLRKRGRSWWGGEGQIRGAKG
jgi:hypothetical protein